MQLLELQLQVLQHAIIRVAITSIAFSLIEVKTDVQKIKI